MNFLLLERIDVVEGGILVTVLSTEGHTYQKTGAKALFAAGKTHPVWGNLGSLCVDQELLRQGKDAHSEGRPRQVEIDTRDPSDVEFGYGTYCGGSMRILIEPIFNAHKRIYRELRLRLESRSQAYLVHDLETGDIAVHDTAPEPGDGVLVEAFAPLRPLFVFGATPLTRRLLKCVEDMEFEFHVIDWRRDYLDKFRTVDGVTVHLDEHAFDEDSFVLIQSHDFRRDKAMIKEALARECAFVGMLSSRSRRDTMFQELREEGVSPEALGRVSSPVGADLGGRSDPEIAVAIAAELIAFSHK
jgi:xanthine dehydrogenase accessory factor